MPSGKDNVFNLITAQCLGLDVNFLWHDRSHLHKISQYREDLDKNNYYRVIVIESIPVVRGEISLPYDLEKILADNGFKRYKESKKLELDSA